MTGIRSRNAVLILAVLVATGAVLRFHGLGTQSLWCDEVVSRELSRVPGITALIDSRFAHPHAPLYLVVQYFVQKYAGSSEAVLRASAAVAGTLSIIAIFFLGRLLYSRTAGLIAAALMAVAWYPLYFSQEARPYALLGLGSILVMYYWVQMLRSLQDGTGTMYAAGKYVICACCICYTHYFGVFLVLLQAAAGICHAALRRRGMMTLAGAYALILFGYAPWLPVIHHLVNHEIQNIAWMAKTSIGDFPLLIRGFFNDSWIITACAAALCLTAAGIAAVTASRAEKTGGRPGPLNPDLLTVLWLIVPFAVIYLKSLVSFPLYIHRYLIISMPAAYLLVARSLARLPLKPAALAVVTGGIMAALLGHLVVVKRYYHAPNKPQLREAARYIVNSGSRYADAAVIGCTGEVNCFDYHFARNGSLTKVFLIRSQDRDMKSIENLLDARKPRYLWLIRDTYLTPSDDVMRLLQQELRFVERRSFYQADVWLFCVDSRAAAEQKTSPPGRDR